MRPGLRSNTKLNVCNSIDASAEPIEFEDELTDEPLAAIGTSSNAAQRCGHRSVGEDSGRHPAPAEVD
eukprot:4416399-Pleurochrysis_carterae.AAC.1